jgi:uncharacterized membrane protein YgdD (TMEM256/DUF423 family)
VTPSATQWRITGTLGALFGLVAAALAAIGSHALELDADGMRRFALGVAFLFVHGLLLIGQAQLLRNGSGLALSLSAALIAGGVLLFSGALIGAALFAWPTLLAPIGGVMLMLGWLMLAFWFLFARR